jgi:hypothetical protein
MNDHLRPLGPQKGIDRRGVGQVELAAARHGDRLAAAFAQLRDDAATEEACPAGYENPFRPKIAKGLVGQRATPP